MKNINTFRVFLLLVLVFPSLAWAAPVGRLIAVESSRSLFEINPGTGEKTSIGSVLSDVGTAGGLAYDSVSGTIYLTSTSQDALYTLDLDTGVATLVGSYGTDVVMHGLEWDSSTETLYAASTIPNTFYRVDTSTGAATEIGSIGLSSFNNLGYDSTNDVMYMTNSGMDRLYTIDRATGVPTLVGPLNISFNPNALAFAPELSTMFMLDNASNNLFSLDLTTGAATLVGSTGPGNLLGLLYLPSGATVETSQWVGDTGDWFVESNWQAGTVPILSDSAVVDNGGTAVVSSSAPSAEVFELRVGNVAEGGLNIVGGGSLANVDGHIGFGAGSSGTVAVSGTGSIWTNTGTLTSGNSGSGTLTIQNGGTVAYAPGDPDRAVHIGRVADAVGVVTVDGAGSSLIASGGHFYVGDAGSGTLTIQNSGVVTHTRSTAQSRVLSIGHQAGATGVVTVTGTGSSLSTTENLLVGMFGTGTLNILNGGMVASDGFGLIGNVAGSVGAVTVDGAGSTWLSNSSLLFVGDQGSGSLTIANGGMVRINAGAGTALVTSAASGIGVLNIGAGGGAGVLDAATVSGGSGSATLNFNHTDSDYFFTRDGTSAGAAIAITGSSAVNHNGSGTTVLTGTNTYSGATNVNAGRLVVDGSLSGNTFVNAGGTLGGSGTVGNLTVSSGGTLSPGNSPGILTVAGDLTLNAGSLTVMEIDGYTPGTQHDQINVSGTATLDGTLQLDFGFVPVNGDRFNLINAASVVRAGDATTGFATLHHNLGAAILATPVIDLVSFDILVQMDQDSFVAAAGGGLTRNQFNVATSLDGFATSGQAAGLFSALNTLSAGQLSDAFDQLSGVQHTHAAVIYPRISRQFHDVLVQRSTGIGSQRGTLVSDRLAGVQLAAAGNNPTTGLAGLGAASPADRRVWLQAMGSFGDIDGDRNASGADYRSGGLALGAEADVSERATLGAALSYTRNDVDVRRGGLDIDSYQAALYGNWQQGDAYVRGTAGFGLHDTDVSRRVSMAGLDRRAKADYKSRTVALSVEGGKAFALSGTVTMTPFGGLDYVHVSRKGFTERAAGDTRLKVSSDRLASLQSVLGIRIQGDPFAHNEGRASAYVEAAWLHEFADRDARLRADFVAAPGNAFRVYGPKLDRDRVRIGAGVVARLTNTADLELSYRGNLARSDKHHALAATVRMRW